MHEHQLGLLGVSSRRVRLPGDLDGIDGLILPGGESTTMSILMDRFGLFEPIRQFGLAKPIFGTCAGMILLSHSIKQNQSGVKTLDLIDIDVERNGYGRQVYSEEAELSLSLGGKLVMVKTAFIRAPRVLRVGPQVSILGEYSNSAVLVCQGKVLASSFHFELEEDTRLLTYFLEDFVGHFAFG